MNDISGLIVGMLIVVMFAQGMILGNTQTNNKILVEIQTKLDNK